MEKMVCNNQGSPKWIFVLYFDNTRKLMHKKQAG
ncbi:unnamed protein product [Withania somnifera]